jgi:hypothetical protein
MDALGLDTFDLDRGSVKTQIMLFQIIFLDIKNSALANKIFQNSAECKISMKMMNDKIESMNQGIKTIYQLTYKYTNYAHSNIFV